MKNRQECLSEEASQRAHASLLEYLGEIRKRTRREDQLVPRILILLETGDFDQLTELMSQHINGNITKAQLQALIEHRNPFEKENFTSLDFAIKILGKQKVISAEQAAKAWEMETPTDPIVRYSKAILRKCAKENERQRKEDWRLIYINGLSLFQQLKIRGTDFEKQPSFARNNNWWVYPQEEYWTTIAPIKGYYLINFNCPNFGILDCDGQEKEIASLGKQYERCHEAVFSEAVFSIFMVNKGEIIAEHWLHRGVSKISDGKHVCIGHFNLYHSLGLHLEFCWDDNKSLRLVTAIKQDS